MDSKLIPIKNVLEIINSCETTSQLDSCLNVINSYTLQLKHNGVINSDLVKKRLVKEHKQKKFQLTMLKYFVRTQQEIFYKEFAA